MKEVKDPIVGMRVVDKKSNIGIIERVDDIHNVFVEYDNGGSGLHCLVKDCQEIFPKNSHIGGYKVNHYDPLYHVNSLFDFAKFVFNCEGLSDWKFKFGVPPSECIDELKLIRISDTYKGEAIYYQCEIFLHEIAHIGGLKHGEKFYKKLGKLFEKYAPEIENYI